MVRYRIWFKGLHMVRVEGFFPIANSYYTEMLEIVISNLCFVFIQTRDKAICLSGSG